MYIYIKRIIDGIFSFAGLLVLFPLMVVCAILIKLNSKGPVFFIQQRVGFNEKVFTIIKFRTMRVSKNDLETDKDRLTTIGKILRRSSLDEIPQLINILKGDMSFIGPRPLPVQYLTWYTKDERKRHNVRPGISGLAQINGRNNLSWNEKFQYDIFYVNNISFKNDLIIFFKTIIKVFNRSDVVVRTENDGEIDFDVLRKREGSVKKNDYI
ncbi:sugar transferase [Enterococcus casseliflavus]|uniref:sugar transferase n=1 Tax=Enterococcus casseliflavus TaxID=37734 RepID=UPI003D0A8C12